jgi:hypothetical protein
LVTTSGALELLYMDSRFGGEDADTAESVTAVMGSKLYYYYLP